MKIIKTLSHNPKETVDLGARLARYLKKGDIVCLLGDLGTGKTTFVKGLARGLKVNPKHVNSPTFVLLNIYKGRLPLYHFDFYRLEGQGAIATIGYEDFLYGEGVAVIEWAERLQELKEQDHLHVELAHRKGTERLIKISAKGKRYKEFLKKWKP